MKYLINQAMRTQALPREHSSSAFRIALLWTIVLFFVASCASVPHTGRRQFNFLSDGEMNALGLKAFKKVLEKEQVSQDSRLTSVVKRVTQRVSKAAETLDRPGFQWEVKVIDKDVPNAVCLPGGKIIVFTGIIPYARNEAGLAAIISHEVAHAVARHGAERLSQQLALKGALAIGGEVLKEQNGKLDARSRVILGALGLGGTLGVLLPYSRTHELEADRIGQLYMARAGYDPSEAVSLWRRMSRIKKPPIPVWLSTHPADDQRIRALKKALPEAQRQYAEAPVKSGKGVLL